MIKVEEGNENDVTVKFRMEDVVMQLIYWPIEIREVDELIKGEEDEEFRLKYLRAYRSYCKDVEVLWKDIGLLVLGQRESVYSSVLEKAGDGSFTLQLTLPDKIRSMGANDFVLLPTILIGLEEA
ncbi:hypothetical protein [Salipaludibacillus daqingensis]|uniref:hypothetical protein n=1 Tax=Salipaludibacillus daqingensis TaxID=3041001 RepID=UPI0024764233|nr:hypothetical protein [Salipaludibacillus daqingensis]